MDWKEVEWEVVEVMDPNGRAKLDGLSDLESKIVEIELLEVELQVELEGWVAIPVIPPSNSRLLELLLLPFKKLKLILLRGIVVVPTDPTSASKPLPFPLAFPSAD